MANSKLRSPPLGGLFEPLHKGARAIGQWERRRFSGFF
jgi:hypothetical protein